MAPVLALQHAPLPGRASHAALSGGSARRGNKGAFIRFTGGDMAPAFTTYPASPHPNVRPMAYASFMGGMFGGM